MSFEKVGKFESSAVETPEKKSESKHWEIEQLRGPTEIILDEMRLKINNGEYPRLSLIRFWAVFIKKKDMLSQKQSFLRAKDFLPQQIRNIKPNKSASFLINMLLKK